MLILLLDSGGGGGGAIDNSTTLPGEPGFNGENYQLICVTDYSDTAVDRLLKQLDCADRFKALVRAYVDEAQAVEDQLCLLIPKNDIDQADDAYLDDLGSLVGEIRAGRTDATYRDAIKGKILVVTSEGNPADLIGIVQAIFGDSFQFELIEHPFATVVVCFNQITTAADAEFMHGQLNQAKAAGVNLQTKYMVSAASSVFTLSSQLSVLETSSSLGTANTGQTTGGHLAGVFRS